MDFLLRLFQIERTGNAEVGLWFDMPVLWSTVAVLTVLAVPALVLPLLRLGGTPWWRRGALICLRCLLVSLLVLLLLKPSVVLMSPVQVKEKVAVLLDASRSMSIGAGPDAPSRWSRALEALEEGALAGLSDQFDLEYYVFGDALTPIAGLDALGAVLPEDEETDLGGAFAELTREGKDLGLGAVVVLSDGIERGGLRKAWRVGGDEALRGVLGAMDLPVHTLAIGAGDPFVDLAIDDIDYNEFAFLRQPFKVHVVVRGSGLDGTSTLVRLTSEGRLLGTRQVVFSGSDAEVTVDFEIDPTRVGKFTYTVSSPVLAGEAVAENNRKSFTLKVVRDRTRVLQVAGAPSWDVKFLRRLLKSDPNIDLVSFFILRGPSDQSMFPPRAYSLIEFPYQDLFDLNRDLKSFDVVVFQNFAYRPYLRDQSVRLLGSLAEFVRRGGGLAMLGGEMAFAAGEYGGTPLEEVMPVRCDRAPSAVAMPVRFALTPQGRRHPVTILHFDPAQNRKQWDALPALDGYNPTSPQADAVVLGTVAGHPDMPLLAVRNVGKGRTLALMTDASWNWSFKAAGEGRSGLAYVRFWKNALRWLVGDPDEGQVEVDTERENYRRGEETVIQLKVAGADYAPVAGATVDLEVFRDEVGATPVHFEGTTGPAGEFIQRFEAPEAGPYRVRATVTGPGVTRGRDETVFTVSEEGPEMKDLAADGAFLAALARVTGGQAVSEDRDGAVTLEARRNQTLSRRTVASLWDRWPPYLLGLALLGLEWALRRRWGLR